MHTLSGLRIEMNSTTYQRTTEELRKMFAVHGLPQQLVSNNSPQLISDEFANFMKANGIKRIRCSPYHPASNGVEKAMKASTDTSFSLASFLLSYHTTPDSTTNDPLQAEEIYAQGWIYCHLIVKKQSLTDKQIKKQGMINIFVHVNLQLERQ